MKKLLLALSLLVATDAFAGVARFIDYGLATGSNNGTSWANAYKTCGKVDSLIAAGTIVAGDTIVFKPNDTLYDCSISLPQRAGSPVPWTVFCDSTFYATGGSGSHYSTHGPGSNPPVLYGGHLVTDDASNPSNAWIQHSGNVYKARWQENCYSWYQSQGSIVCPVIQNHDSMLVVLPSSAADVNAAGESYYDDTKDTIYVWKFGGGDPDAGGGTPFILSRAAVFQQIDDESTTRGWGSVPGVCCAPPVGGAKRIKITGLDVRGGQPGVIFQNNAAVMDSSVIQHCHLSRGMYEWGQNGSVVFSDGISATNGQYNGLVACSLGWGGTRPQTGSASWPGGMFTHGGAVTLYRQEHFHVDSCYFYGWAEFGVDYKMDGGAASEYRGNVVRYSIFNPNPESPQWERHALRMSVKQKKDSVYGCIFVDGDRNVFLQADGQQSGGAVMNDSSFICNNTFYNVGSFLYVGEFLASRCGIGHTVKWNLIHDYRPGAGFGGDIGVFSNNNYPTAQVCVDVFGEIDENVYYDPTSAFTFDKSDYGQGMSFAQWRTTPAFDVNSTVSATGLLVDPADGDYSPTAAVPHLNINYGGKNWTRYGAIQEPPGTNICPTITVNLPVAGDTIAATVATLDADFNDANGELLDVTLLFEAGDTTPDIEVADTTLTADDDWVYQVTGLIEDADYYRRYMVVDTGSCTTYSAIYRFTVDSVTNVPPTDTSESNFNIAVGSKIR